MNEARPVLSAFGWIPDFARGHVRDLRIRWALEEIGRPYVTELFAATRPRPDSYKTWQPFGQVPAFRDKGLDIFESGAILLYLGEQDERLLPGGTAERWRAISWLFAALNSIEPPLQQMVIAGIFFAKEDWSRGATMAARELAEGRLNDLSLALGDEPWLGGSFSIADIAMVTVLRLLDHTDMLERWPNLAAYRRRGIERPAFGRARAAQLADHDSQPQQPMEGA